MGGEKRTGHSHSVRKRARIRIRNCFPEGFLCLGPVLTSFRSQRPRLHMRLSVTMTAATPSTIASWCRRSFHRVERHLSQDHEGTGLPQHSTWKRRKVNSNQDDGSASCGTHASRLSSAFQRSPALSPSQSPTASSPSTEPPPPRRLRHHGRREGDSDRCIFSHKRAGQ